MIVNRDNLAGIYTSFSTLFNQTLETTKVLWDRVATQVPSESAKNDYKWLGAIPMLREWIGERYIKSLEAFKYEVANKNFESTVSVDRDDVEDDTIGVYRPMIQALAANAKVHPDKLIFDLLKNGFSSLCFDGQYFFDTDHPVGESSVSNTGGGSGNAWFLLDVSKFVKPTIVQIRKSPEFVALDNPTDENVFKRREFIYGVEYRGNVGYALWQLAYGSKDTLSEANYSAAREAMAAFKNDEGVPLNIMPGLLVVGPSNEKEAREILERERNAQGETNIWKGTADLLVTAWLD